MWLRSSERKDYRTRNRVDSRMVGSGSGGPARAVQATASLAELLRQAKFASWKPKLSPVDPLTYAIR